MSFVSVEVEDGLVFRYLVWNLLGMSKFLRLKLFFFCKIYAPRATQLQDKFSTHTGCVSETGEEKMFLFISDWLPCVLGRLLLLGLQTLSYCITKNVPPSLRNKKYEGEDWRHPVPSRRAYTYFSLVSNIRKMPPTSLLVAEKEHMYDSLLQHKELEK